MDAVTLLQGTEKAGHEHRSKGQRTREEEWKCERRRREVLWRGVIFVCAVCGDVVCRTVVSEDEQIVMVL